MLCTMCYEYVMNYEYEMNDNLNDNEFYLFCLNDL